MTGSAAAVPVQHGVPSPDPDGEDTTTRALAREISGLRWEAIGQAVRVVAGQCLLDGTAVAVAAREEPAVATLRETILAEGAPGPATLLGTASRTTARDAALVNGTASHALDYDDVSAPMSGHPTVPVLPAVLALGEELGANGTLMLTALVAGIETEVRLGEALGPSHYLRGFHTTATAGTVGAAAAAARMLGLSTNATTAALGIAATHASGLKSMFGTMCKPLHAGSAAAAGVLAAKLAARGFTSADDALGAEQGLLAVTSDAPDHDAMTRRFGAPWHTTNVLFKFHAACYLTHAAIEAALELRARGLRAEDVDAINLTVTPDHLGVCAIPAPRTGLEGKFSLRFTTALALATGRAGEAEFTDATVADPDLVALGGRIRLLTSDGLGRHAAQVTVRGRDGRSWQADADVGTPQWTSSPTEQTPALLAKFDALVAPVLGSTGAAQLRSRLEHPESVASITEITELAGTAGATGADRRTR